MEILVNKPLHPHDCAEEIEKDPRSGDLGFGSIVRCDCGNTYILRDHQWDGKYWALHDMNRA